MAGRVEDYDAMDLWEPGERSADFWRGVVIGRMISGSN